MTCKYRRDRDTKEIDLKSRHVSKCQGPLAYLPNGGVVLEKKHQNNSTLTQDKH